MDPNKISLLGFAFVVIVPAIIGLGYIIKHRNDDPNDLKNGEH